MFEIKFKEFRFRDFMDFVLNLADIHGLGQVRFNPERRELFDDYQLSHISPTRDVEDRRGFVWAWSKKQDEVRRVTFNQFSNDNKKKVNITIDLDKGSIKLNDSMGISPIVVEELAEKRFAQNSKQSVGGNDDFWTFKKNFFGFEIDFKKFFEYIKNKKKKNGKEQSRSTEANSNPWLVEIIGGIIVGVIILAVGFYFFKQPTQIKPSDIVDYDKNSQEKKTTIPETEFKTTAIKLDESIFLIINKHEQNEYVSALDKQVDFKKYTGMQASGERAVIKYIQEDINGKVVDVLLESVDYPISIYCFFKAEWLQKLSLLDKEEPIEFSGKVGNYSNGIVYLSNCELE